MKLDLIVCLGDSLTNGARDELYLTYPAELTKLLHRGGHDSYWCLNCGVNGETTSHMLDRAYRVLAANDKARFMLFLGGTNDTKVPVPAEVFVGNLNAITTLALRFGIEPVLGLLPPIYGGGLACYSPRGGNDLIDRYNAAIREHAQTRGLRTTDFSRYGPELYSDGIHLNHEGYTRMAKDWLDTISASL